MNARLLGLVALLSVLSAVGRADDRPLPPPECAPRYAEDLPAWREWMRVLGPDWLAGSRAGEARRIGDDARVFRYLDRLYLVRDDLNLVTLTDCIFGSGMYRFAYDHFDDTGDFYVVAKYEYRHSYYVVISRTSGAEFIVFSRPDWSPDRKRFAHGACNAMSGPDELYVVRHTEQGPQAEASIPLPCKGGECTFSWESATVISVSCPNEVGNRGKFRFVLQGDTWTKVPN